MLTGVYYIECMSPGLDETTVYADRIFSLVCWHCSEEDFYEAIPDSSCPTHPMLTSEANCVASLWQPA